MHFFQFRQTSLIYAENFQFENPVIMQDKQCKQTEQFSVMAKGSDYFLSLDVKSKQRYKVKVILFSLSLLNKEELKA